jgi:hypothetical protein
MRILCRDNTLAIPDKMTSQNVRKICLNTPTSAKIITASQTEKSHHHSPDKSQPTNISQFPDNFVKIGC